MRAFLALAAALAASVPAGAQEAPVPDTHYIPPDARTGIQPDSDGDFHEHWFGKHLASMHEPPLWPAAAITDYRARYRILVLPSFAEPYVIRVDVRADGGATAFYTRTDGRGGYAAGDIIAQHRRPVSRTALAAIRRRLTEARFDARVSDKAMDRDQFGTPLPRTDELVICADGTHFVIEARTRSGDHMVERSQCELDAGLRALIRAIAAAGGVQVSRDSLL